MAPDAFEFLSCHSDNLTARFPRIKKDACLRAMHLVLPDGSIIIGERAVPEILQRIRGYRWAAALFRLPGTGIFSRIFYRWFAKNRFHISRALSPGRPPI
jgi:predicted DCC family thiol-disulfide oxidoreductase YuxK